MKASLLSAKIFPQVRRGSWPLAALALAVVAGAVVFHSAFNSVRPSEAGRSYVQMASDGVLYADHVSAHFLKVPAAGNLLVAIASTRDGAPVLPPAGWQVAIDESLYSPGQAIFYKIASEGEDRLVVVEYGEKVRAGLQLFEYSDIDTGNPLDVVVSDAGRGLVVHTGAVTNTSERGLALAAFVADSLVNFVSDFKNDFTLRNLDRTRGDGSFSFGSADRPLYAEFTYSTAAMLSRNAAWRGQLVVFHRRGGDTLVPAATLSEGWVDLGLALTASDEQPQEREDVTFQYIVTNQGTEPAHNVIVQGALPPGLSLVSAVVTDGTYSPGAGLWRLAEVPANSTLRLTVQARVDPETQRSSLIARSKILVVDEPDLNDLNDEAFVSLDIQPTPPAVEQPCPPIGSVVFAVQDQNGEVDDPSVLLDATAANATYLLVNDVPDRLAARSVSLGQGVGYDLDPALGNKTLYAWFGNYCSTTFVVTDATRLVAPAPVVPAEPPAVTDLDVATTDADVVTDADQNEAPPPPPPAAACLADRQFVNSMRNGDVGDEVKSLQALLQCLGYFPQATELSGIFGPITEKAVADFQAAEALTPYGFVGPNTLKALNQYYQE